MKQLLNIFLLLLIANLAIAQAPQGIPYQAVARNSSGSILTSTATSVRFTIRDSVASGTIKYRETFSVTTSSQGMFSVNVGQGTPVTGTFAGINWGTNAKFIQVEMDPSGGSSYVDMGTTQMMSVPYALSSATASSVSLTVSATGDTLYSGVGKYVIIPGISAANCTLPSPGTITGTATVTSGSTITLSNTTTGGVWNSGATGIATIGSTGVVTGIAAGTATISYTVTNGCGSAVVTRVVTVSAAAGLPIITTTTVGAIVSCAASSGGSISSDGGASITARGVVWSTSPGPTVVLTTKTSDGTGAGTFTSSITGLTASTTYYVRAYGTNSSGTAYGTEYSFTTLAGTMCIGATYGGGKIAYILQPGDPGYVPGETHGLIAAISDQSTAAPWGCMGIVTGSTNGNLGSGATNTTTILSFAPSSVTAAQLCHAYSGGGYTDWFLPSTGELQKLYDNRSLIGGFVSCYCYYWSSTERDAGATWSLNFANGSFYYNGYFVDKNYLSYVRAVRYF